MSVEIENPSRAVFLTSTIDFDAYEKLAPEIIRLRLADSSPICLYVHSAGGLPFIAERIMRLIRAPRQDGKRCMITTVCMGMAASAAADMVSSGDYAIGYNEAVFLYHGTREQHEEVTVEKLREVTENLQQANEYFAMKLASQMFRRFATQALLLEVFKTTPPSSSVIAVEAAPENILSRIRENVQPEHQKLVDSAVERMKRVRLLFEHVGGFEKRKKHSRDLIGRDCRSHLINT